MTIVYREYIGDGVYAGLDEGGQLTLQVPGGSCIPQGLALELPVFVRLLDYAHRLGGAYAQSLRSYARQVRADDAAEGGEDEGGQDIQQQQSGEPSDGQERGQTQEEIQPPLPGGSPEKPPF